MTNNKIVTLGSLNMDLTIRTDRMPESGETIHGFDFMMNEGGKGGNQAVGAAKQGADVFFLGAIGKDVFGEKLEAALTRFSINTGYLQRIQNVQSGIATIIIADGDNRIILDAGANFMVDVDVMVENLKAIGREDDIFVTQFEVSEECVIAGLKQAKALGMKTILNPAPARTIKKEIYSYTDIIVVNQSECHIITGIYPETKDDCKNALLLIREMGIPCGIITLGTKGSYSEENGRLIHIPSIKVKSVDTTAAGDSYIGALAARLLAGDTLKDSMIYATKVAAITVTRIGAQSAIPFKAEVLIDEREE